MGSMVMAGRTFLTISDKVIQPFILFNLIKPWLQVFRIAQLSSGFSKLQTITALCLTIRYKNRDDKKEKK
jgi:hypothetical protein